MTLFFSSNSHLYYNFLVKKRPAQASWLIREYIQAPLVNGGLFICGFAYSRSKNWLFKEPILQFVFNWYWSFYSWFNNLCSSIRRTYLPQITRETCTLFLLARERNARILATIELKQQRCRALVQLLRSINEIMIGIGVFAIRGFENLWTRKQEESLK